MDKRKTLLIQIGIGMAAFMGSVYVACSSANDLMGWYDIDDAFYYFKVAQNALAGQGFTFDGINLSNGFHPLWMVICLGVFGLSRLNLLLPLRVLAVVSGLLNAGSAILLFHLLKRAVRPIFAITGALTWALVPSIYNITTMHGMESAISTFFILLLLNAGGDYFDLVKVGKAKPRHLAVLGIIGGLTILSRLDNVFLVAIMGIFAVLRINRLPRLVNQDLILIFCASAASFFLMPEFYAQTLGSFSIYPMLVLGLVIKPFCFTLAGFYDESRQAGGKFSFLRLICGVALAVFAFTVVGFGLHNAHLIRYFSGRLTVLDCGLTALLIIASRISFKQPAQTTAKGIRADFKFEWKRIFQGGLAYGSPVALLVGAYLFVNRFIFGTFTPVSGQIKQWWGTLSNTVYSGNPSMLSIFGLDIEGGITPWTLLISRLGEISGWITLKFKLVGELYAVVVFLLVTALYLLLMAWGIHAGKVLKDNPLCMGVLVLLFACLFQIAYYASSGYTGSRSWYWVSEMILLVIIGTLFLEGSFRWLENRKVPAVFSQVIGGVLITCFMVLHGRFLYRVAPLHNSTESQISYLSDIAELQNLIPEGSMIGMTGGGTTAYFLPSRTIVNLDGLINCSEYFSALKDGTAGEFLDSIPLDYVYGTPYTLFVSDPYAQVLKGRLREIETIDGPEKFTLYEYIPAE